MIIFHFMDSVVSLNVRACMCVCACVCDRERESGSEMKAAVWVYGPLGKRSD